MPKKGAIELSLGFIVTVVFAVVLLSLAIMWLQGLFPQFGSLTEDLTRQAQDEITKTFEETSSDFGIWPDRRDIERGKGILMAAGIKNDADDGETHTFVVNVIPGSASKTACPEGDINLCQAPGGGTLKESMQTSWMDWVKEPFSSGIDKTTYRHITVKVPNNAKKGTYIFNVVACIDKTTYSECTPTALNWGTAQQLSVTVV